jgi:choline dehydrogenase-like flavoprotein
VNIGKRRVYDVCVVGSGAAGGFMSKELTEAGADTILIEAGRKVDRSELYIHDFPYELPRRGFGFNRQQALYPDNISKEIEYEGSKVDIDRIRVLGGRTLHWNALSLRFSEDDFRERSLNGIEEDWPISYQELAPFYSYVERIVGLCGTKEGLKVLPDSEYVSPPPNLRCSEFIAKRACDKLGIRLIPTRKAISIKGFDGRPPCHYCGHCMDVCDANSIFTSVDNLIPKALKTGKLTLRTNALANRVLVDSDGRATGVSIIDRVTKREEEIYAKVVVVSCSTVESARLLLNSANHRFPNGLSNSNDLVGRYLHGHSVTGLIGYLKDLAGSEVTNNDGANEHSYIPRFNHERNITGYKGGYAMFLQSISFMHPHHAQQVEGFGVGLKARVRELQPGMLQIGGFGKVLARKENRVTVNKSRVDQFGIPVPVVKFEFCDNDLRLFDDMKESIEEIYHKAGVELLLGSGNRIVGFASHEVGTCRMGNNPKSSVLNRYNQSHEISNLFVVDGSCFVTFPEKNPTLTIMALAVRSAQYIVDQRRKGNL